MNDLTRIHIFKDLCHEYMMDDIYEKYVGAKFYRITFKWGDNEETYTLRGPDVSIDDLYKAFVTKAIGPMPDLERDIVIWNRQYRNLKIVDFLDYLKEHDFEIVLTRGTAIWMSP